MLAKMHQTTAFDVADYILTEFRSILGENRCFTRMTLQKLVYYSQAWNLAWHAEPLFHQRLVAWTTGPVIPKLYDLNLHCWEEYQLTSGPGNFKFVKPKQREGIDEVIDTYGRLEAEDINNMVCNEGPMMAACLREMHTTRPLAIEREHAPVIRIPDMRDYYQMVYDEHYGDPRSGHISAIRWACDRVRLIS